MQSLPAQSLDDFGHACGVRHRIVWKSAARRVGRIGAWLSVHLIRALGFLVVRRQGVVVDRPRRRDAIGMPHLVEIFAAHAVEHAAPELGIAANVVVRVREKFGAVLVEPPLSGSIPELLPHRLRAPVLLLLRDEIAALENEDTRCRVRQGVGSRPSARAAADDDDVVTLVQSCSISRWSSMARSRLISGARPSLIDRRKSRYIA